MVVFYFTVFSFFFYSEEYFHRLTFCLEAIFKRWKSCCCGLKKTQCCTVNVVAFVNQNKHIWMHPSAKRNTICIIQYWTYNTNIHYIYFKRTATFSGLLSWLANFSFLGQSALTPNITWSTVQCAASLQYQKTPSFFFFIRGPLQLRTVSGIHALLHHFITRKWHEAKWRPEEIQLERCDPSALHFWSILMSLTIC